MHCQFLKQWYSRKRHSLNICRVNQLNAYSSVFTTGDFSIMWSPFLFLVFNFHLVHYVFKSFGFRTFSKEGNIRCSHLVRIDTSARKGVLWLKTTMSPIAFIGKFFPSCINTSWFFIWIKITYFIMYYIIIKMLTCTGAERLQTSMPQDTVARVHMDQVIMYFSIYGIWP